MCARPHPLLSRGKPILDCPLHIPRPPSFSPHSVRPGRTRKAAPTDTAHRHSFGDNVYFKDPQHTRLFFSKHEGPHSLTHLRGLQILSPCASQSPNGYCRGVRNKSSLESDIILAIGLQTMSQAPVPYWQGYFYIL